MNMSMKQARKFKQTMAIATVALSIGCVISPVVAHANTKLPTSMTQLKNSRNAQSINTDMNGLGQLTYTDDDTSRIGYYLLNGDSAGTMVNNAKHNNVAIGYSGITPSAVMSFNGNFAFCLQNSKGNPVGKPGVTIDPNLSAYANSLMLDVMVLGFPNVASSDLGFSGDNSALHSYMATQYALWAAEQGGKIESADGSMVDISSLSDGAGVGQAAYALYQKAQELEKNGGVSSLTKNTHDEEKANAEAKLADDMKNAVAEKTEELNNKVDNDLAKQQISTQADMTNYMKGVSDKALSGVENQAKTDGQKVLDTLIGNVSGDKFKPTASFTSDQYAYMDKDDSTRTFTFTANATMPKFEIGTSDLHALIPDTTTKLDVKNGYEGKMVTTASGKAVANTSGEGLNDTGDTVNALTIKLDRQLPSGSYIVQDGQKITAKDNQTYVLKNNVKFEVHIPSIADSDTSTLSYDVQSNTVISLAEFNELAKTELSGTENIKSSASDTASAKEEYIFQEGAKVGVEQAGVGENPALQNVGTFVLDTNVTQATDEVSDSKPVNVNKNKDVKQDYKDQKNVKLDLSKTANRQAKADTKYSWDKDAVQFANTGLMINKYALISLVTALMASITGVVIYFKKYHKRIEK